MRITIETQEMTAPNCRSLKPISAVIDQIPEVTTVSQGCHLPEVIIDQTLGITTISQGSHHQEAIRHQAPGVITISQECHLPAEMIEMMNLVIILVMVEEANTV